MKSDCIRITAEKLTACPADVVLAKDSLPGRDRHAPGLTAPRQS